MVAFTRFLMSDFRRVDILQLIISIFNEYVIKKPHRMMRLNLNYLRFLTLLLVITNAIVNVMAMKAKKEMPIIVEFA